MSTLTVADRDTLNTLIDFDSPFTIDDSEPANLLRYDAAAPSVPSVYLYVDADGNGVGEEEIDGTGWAPVSGFSGQYGYRGPVMHASEQLGGGMADWVIENPGTYVVVAVECLSEEGGDEDLEPAGWMLLRLTK
jgi:hypothetical protein